MAGEYGSPSEHLYISDGSLAKWLVSGEIAGKDAAGLARPERGLEDYNKFLSRREFLASGLSGLEGHELYLLRTLEMVSEDHSYEPKISIRTPA